MREQDRKLKGKFQQFSIVPPEDVWYKIEQRLSSKQRGLFFIQEIQKINFIAAKEFLEEGIALDNQWCGKC